MKALQELITNQEALKKEFVTKATSGFKEALKELFAEVPTLKALKWNQYTPYFNDGDACTFRVGEVYFKLDDTAEDAGDYEDGFDGTWTIQKTNPALAKTLDAFGSLIQSKAMRDILLDMFDDHQEIVCTRDGNVETSEYSHD